MQGTPSLQGQDRFAGVVQVTDPVTQQPTVVTLRGEYRWTSQRDPVTADHISAHLQHAASHVLAQAVTSGQASLGNLAPAAQLLAHEIVRAATGLSGAGIAVQFGSLEASAGAPAAPQGVPAGFAPGQMPADPYQATARAYERIAQDKLAELDPRNKEYEARIKIGGFKLKASTDEGFDTEGLKDQVKEKAKSTVIWWGIGCAIIGIVIVGLAGLAWYIYAQTVASTSGKGGLPAPSKGAAEVVTWDGKSGYSCGGSENVKIQNVTAVLASGTAVTALGACQITLENVTITAPTALKAMANGRITVTGGKITGKTTAASALGNGQITFQGTVVEGKKQATGASAKISGP